MNKHHVAAYNGKTVLMDYVPANREFVLACMRIQDNGASGYVLTPKGKIFRVTQGKRLAILLQDADAFAVEKAAALLLFVPAEGDQ